MTTSKVKRWMDLIGLLLARRNPVTRDEILQAVEDYGLERRLAAGDRPVPALTGYASARRKFERDKDDLRRVGLNLETVRIPDPGVPHAVMGYRLRPLGRVPVQVVVEGEPAPPGDALDAELRLSPADFRLVERAVDQLAARGGHPLSEAARSARRTLKADGDTEGPRPARRLMPQEVLACQVALLMVPDGVAVARRLAGPDTGPRITP